MGRRDRRLQRIERARAKKRKLEAAVRLGASGLKTQLTSTERHLTVLTKALDKRVPAKVIPDRHPLHSHPDGALNRELGALRVFLLDVAPTLYGDECAEALYDIREKLADLIQRDQRARKLRPLLDEVNGRLVWLNIRTEQDRAKHYREQQSLRREHARLKRQSRGPGAPWRHWRHWRRQRHACLVNATRPCQCWLCKNAHLFDRKTGKARNAA